MTHAPPSEHNSTDEAADTHQELLPPSRPFSANSSRRGSISSTASQSSLGGRVQVGGSPRNSVLGYGSPEVSDTAEELRLESLAAGASEHQYAFERPLDAVKRHSRALDFAPMYGAPREHRASSAMSINTNIALLDPFGYANTSTSPYDTALQYSANAHTRSRASPLGSRNPSSSDLTSTSASTSVVALNAWGIESGPGSNGVPWEKRRSASMGEEERGSRSRGRSVYLASGLSGEATRAPSKLSAEIEAAQDPLHARPATTPSLATPLDTEYLNSKLYKRSLKAQKSLDKERLKKGSVSTTPSGRTSGTPSFMSDAPSVGRRRFSWFRSSSEVALASPQPSPPLPSSVAPPVDLSTIPLASLPPRVSSARHLSPVAGSSPPLTSSPTYEGAGTATPLAPQRTSSSPRLAQAPLSPLVPTQSDSSSPSTAPSSEASPVEQSTFPSPPTSESCPPTPTQKEQQPVPSTQLYENPSARGSFSTFSFFGKRDKKAAPVKEEKAAAVQPVKVQAKTIKKAGFFSRHRDQMFAGPLPPTAPVVVLARRASFAKPIAKPAPKPRLSNPSKPSSDRPKSFFGSIRARTASTATPPSKMGPPSAKPDNPVITSREFGRPARELAPRPMPHAQAI